MRAIWILSLADVFTSLVAPCSKGTPRVAPAAAVVKNSRREVTPYFLSDDEEAVVVELVELVFELSEVEVLALLPESLDELDASFLSDFSDFSEEFFSDELSPSFFPPPFPWPLPLLA